MHTVLMGSVLRLVALVLATSSISGCFHSMDMVRERHRPGRTLESSDTTESLIEKTRSVTLSYQLVEGELRVDAQETHRCSRERLDTYSNVEIVTQHLPSSHWWTFGSGLLLSGVGAAGILMGADLNPEGADGSIMEPGEAEDRDMGRIMVPVGTAIAAVGGVLLGSEITDWVLLSDRQLPKRPTSSKVPLDDVDCRKGPAKKVELSISPPPTGGGGGHRINFRADEKGSAVLDVIMSPLVDYSFASPFAMLTCEGCEAQPLELPPQITAELVVAGNRKKDLEAWLEAYPDLSAPMAAPVVAALREIGKREEEIKKINPERERSAAQEDLWAGRVMRARKSAVRCLLKSPRHPGCKKLLGEIDGIVLRDMVDRAKQYMRWQVPQRALLVLEECLEIRPRYRACTKLKTKAGKMWTKAKRGVSYRVRRIEKKRAATTIVTELKSRNDHENLRVSIAVYQGDDPICMHQHTVGGIARQETVAFEVPCETAIENVDRVVLRVEGTDV